MAAIDFTDNRVQIVLRGIRDHADCSLSELWFLEWNRHFTGYTGKGKFNHGFVERMVPRLIKSGFVLRARKNRLSLTAEGLASITKRV
ncbi:hypothetical protein N9917_04975 [Deltaproteobacteria bacterium]|nr:hypothetical protein [Deltaproteobacteria bacterium]